MTTYERETRIRAPLSAVWDFHSRTSGLEALTPDWLGLRIDAVVGPEGDRDPEILREGAEIDCSVRPLGIGPRLNWTSVIVERSRDSGTAHFRDEMIRGPFEVWDHTHSFYADGDATICRDRIVYRVTGGETAPSRSIDRAAWLGFEPMFRYRHRRTATLMEGRTDPSASNRRRNLHRNDPSDPAQTDL